MNGEWRCEMDPKQKALIKVIAEVTRSAKMKTEKMKKKFLPVIVNSTWMVSSPAVLLTQHKYLPESSILAFEIFNSPPDTMKIRSLNLMGVSCSFSSRNHL